MAYTGRSWRTWTKSQRRSWCCHCGARARASLAAPRAIAASRVTKRCASSALLLLPHPVHSLTTSPPHVHGVQGRWEARIGQLVGKKYRYLGLFDTENEVRRFVRLADDQALFRWCSLMQGGRCRLPKRTTVRRCGRRAATLSPTSVRPPPRPLSDAHKSHVKVD
jgi:hypothetical protein